MNTVSVEHERAMERADQALEARRQGDEARAIAFFREAFVHEQRAAEQIALQLDAEPSRSVLHRGAASLAVQCGEFREAERFIAVALSGNPPDEIAEELRDLWQQVCRDLRRLTVAAG